jgi:CRP-like cAMP-binding protein/thioredoxin reductase/Pyruvate/2-oxoacid:ferredoxin oxidoreductase delta subunit
MGETFKVAVIGAGPGGLSAAAHAAELGVSHVLLEKSPAHANTIQRYQKGKHVMAEPGILPLRSPLPFAAGKREKILQDWHAGLAQHKVNVRYDSEVVAISGQRPQFEIRLKSGATLTAENVVFGIGVQGNPRILDIPGHELCVQYQLDDPEEYRDESIMIVGVGDAGLENALGLAGHNTVHILNTGAEFDRAKEGNRSAVLQAIDNGKINCYYNSKSLAIEKANNVSGTQAPFEFVIETPTGQARVPVHRVIARIGAIAPRRFVESCGIQFPNADPTALPTLSPQYESNVPGLYIIGALGGYPLIKQAMNQGYEVIEYVLGRKIDPVDHPLLTERFKHLPFGLDVNGVLDLMQERVPLYAPVNKLMFREMVLGSEVHRPALGTVVFRKHDYTNSFFVIVQGSVDIELGEDERQYRLTLSQGEFFGEMSLLSGRRRSGTVYAGADCVLLETPRREVAKLLASVDAVRKHLDQEFVIRAIRAAFAPQTPAERLRPIAARAQLRRFKIDETLFKEGDEADALHLIRSGSVAVSRVLGGRDVVTSYVAAGNYVGEMGLMGGTRRTATIRANVPTETVSLDAATFSALLEANPALRGEVQETVRKRLAANTQMQTQPGTGDLISFLLQQGLGEATDVLLIDEALCVGCDNCETACAETHGGTSRLDRAAGPTFAHVHVPTSCRHCENPHCMKDCPPDAIRRAPNGEVFIRDNCIGCGNCERNCPYGVIHMAAPPPAKPGLWQWLLLGRGPGPGEVDFVPDKDVIKRAVKCDMCKDQTGGPACVRACPTGAAIRVSPERFVDFVSQTSRGN